MTGRHVVILGGGKPPPAPDPAPAGPAGTAAMHQALQQLDSLGLVPSGADPTLNVQVGAILTALTRAYWQDGWDAAADRLHPAAAYILDTETDAEQFAAFMTAHVDPAYVLRASPPLAELFAAADELRRRDQAGPA
jgi:hypothetical protein